MQAECRAHQGQNSCAVLACGLPLSMRELATPNWGEGWCLEVWGGAITRARPRSAQIGRLRAALGQHSTADLQRYSHVASAPGPHQTPNMLFQGTPPGASAELAVVQSEGCGSGQRWRLQRRP